MANEEEKNELKQKDRKGCFLFSNFRRIVTGSKRLDQFLREHNESLALGYVVARVFEGFFDAGIAISLLLLLTLSREFVKAGTPTTKTDMDEIK